MRNQPSAVNSSRERPSLVVGHAHRYAGQGLPGGAAAALALVGVGGDHAGFGHAVALKYGVAAAAAEFVEGVEQQWRRSGDEQSHAAADVPVEPWLGEQPRVERGHAHHGGGARHIPDQRLGVEPAVQQDARAGEQDGVHGDKKPVHMEDRQRVDEHVVRGEAPEFAQHLRIRGEIAVGHHCALGPPGGPGGVDDHRQIALGALAVGESGRRAGHGIAEAAPARIVEGEQVLDAMGAGEVAEQSGRFRAAHHHARFGVAEEVAEFALLVSGIERQIAQPRAQRAQVQEQGLGRLVDLRRYPIAGLQAQPGEKGGEARRLALEVGVAERLVPVGLHQLGLEAGRKTAPEKGICVHRRLR